MTDREKVKQGLSCCHRKNGEGYACPFCPYQGKSCCDNLHRDALALLKEQEGVINKLRSTMEDMVNGNASEEVSYLLRLLNRWETKGAENE